MRKKHIQKPNGSSDRKHKVSFPRVTLAKALTLAQAIKDKNGGNPWSSDQAAEAIGMSRKSVNFFYLAAGARDYGLTKGGRDTEIVELESLGREIVYASDPGTELSKKREAFLRVELFRKVLEYYKGANLPEMKYLANTLEAIRVGLTRMRTAAFTFARAKAF
jgi:hypothetical protein